MINANLSQIAKAALAEDMPRGDITTDALMIDDIIGRAKLIAKEDLVLSGVEIFTAVFHEVDPKTQIEWFFRNGQFVIKGQSICLLKGSFASLLKGERTALNFLGRLSGIATLTKCFVNETLGTKTKILDTRKTTPGLRALEKKAVVDGGGTNHRMNLSSAYLIKENHIQAVGGITHAVNKIKSRKPAEIEVEVRTLEEAKEAIQSQATRLLLDNMTNEQMAEVVKIAPASVQTEASGNMSVERIKSVAQIGVDFISVGALTHSAPCADVSLLFDPPNPNLDTPI